MVNISYTILLLLLLITFQFYVVKIIEAINCKPFTTEEAKFAAENFYKIQFYEEENNALKNGKNLDKKVTAAKIVEHFVNELERLIAAIRTAENIDKKTVVKNGRKIMTMATDLCNQMPKKEANGLPMTPGFVSCVEFLFYQHMHRLVWRLVHKWGTTTTTPTTTTNWHRNPLAEEQTNFVENKNENNFINKNNDRKNDNAITLLHLYTEKKANVWQKIRFIYRNELNEFLEGQSERIRRKFGFCLAINGQMRSLKCEPMRREDALFFVKNFHKIPIYEPKFERNKSQIVEDMATNLFNALKLEHRKFVDQKMGEENFLENANKIAKMDKGWKMGEQAMKMRLKVLVDVAGEKCRKAGKNLKRFLNKIGKIFFRKNQKSEFEEENGDAISRDFVACIYHYLYSFVLKLIDNNTIPPSPPAAAHENGGTNGAGNDDQCRQQWDESYDDNDADQCLNGNSNSNNNNDLKQWTQQTRSIYEGLREKMWQKMKLVYAKSDLTEMTAWLRGGNCGTIDHQSGGNETNEEDPFRQCAVSIGCDEQRQRENHQSVMFMDTVSKSFDQHLMPCIGQFLAAVANDQFKYHLFVNFYTKQLDSAIEFPDQMAKRIIAPPSNNDNCNFMREVLASLNKSITNRLNFQKITKRSEKEEWVELHEQLEELLLEREDRSWADRLRRKLHKKTENLRQTYQRWSAMANPIKHPIRDEFRKRHLIRGLLISRSPWGTAWGEGEGKTTTSAAAAAEQKHHTKGRGRRKKRGILTGWRMRDQQVPTMGEGEATGAAEANLDEEEEENEQSAIDPTHIKIDQKIIKIADQIEKHSLSKRFEVYEKIYKAFNIALALTLFDRYAKNNGLINLEFIFDNQSNVGHRHSATVPMDMQVNVEKIKSSENLAIFEEIAKRMGKKLTKGNVKGLLKRKSVESVEEKCENEWEKEAGKREEKLDVIMEEEENKEKEKQEKGEEEKERGKGRPNGNGKEKPNDGGGNDFRMKKDGEQSEAVGKEWRDTNKGRAAGKHHGEIEEESWEEKGAQDEAVTETDTAEEQQWEKRWADEAEGSAAAVEQFEVGPFVIDEQQKAEDKRNGVGFELAHLGYLQERDGAQLLHSFMEEMTLNMDQFGMSWDSDCDMSDDLNQCLMAADGLDFNEQLFRFSLLGKQWDDMGTLERAVELLFNKLNRLSYKFAQKAKGRQTFLARFYYVNIYGINEGLARLISGQISPFEVFVPFYMRMKKGAKFVVRKVMASGPGQAFRAWTLKLFNSVNATLNGREKDIRRELKNGEKNIKTTKMPKNGGPSAQIMSDEAKFNERINPLLSNIVEQTQQEMESQETTNSARYKMPIISKKFFSNLKKNDQTQRGMGSQEATNPALFKMPTISNKFSSNFKRRDKKASNFVENNTSKTKSKLANKFGRVAQTMKNFFIEFMFDRYQQKNAEEKCSANKSVHKSTPKRKKREAFERGAAIAAHIRQVSLLLFFGKMGSSTVRSIMFNSRIIDTSIPGLHLHWLHANGALLLGKYSLAGHLPAALVFSFVIGSLLYWWHAVKLAVYIAMLYGDIAGWAILLVAIAFYVIFFCFFII